jgi:hypothetical protein
VLLGVGEVGEGGVLTAANGSAVTGEWNLGVLGDVGEAKGSGVTVVRAGEVDGKCELFREMYVSTVGEEGMLGL